LERLNQRSLEKIEKKIAAPPHFPFGKKGDLEKKRKSVALDTEPDHEDEMIKDLTDPKQSYNIPRQEKAFFQILKRDSKEVPTQSGAEERIG
jgi:hypothetical protein